MQRCDRVTSPGDRLAIIYGNTSRSSSIKCEHSWDYLLKFVRAFLSTHNSMHSAPNCNYRSSHSRQFGSRRDKPRCLHHQKRSSTGKEKRRKEISVVLHMSRLRSADLCKPRFHVILMGPFFGFTRSAAVTVLSCVNKWSGRTLCGCRRKSKRQGFGLFYISAQQRRGYEGVS